MGMARHGKTDGNSTLTTTSAAMHPHTESISWPGSRSVTARQCWPTRTRGMPTRRWGADCTSCRSALVLAPTATKVTSPPLQDFNQYFCQAPTQNCDSFSPMSGQIKFIHISPFIHSLFVLILLFNATKSLTVHEHITHVYMCRDVGIDKLKGNINILCVEK